MASWRERLRGLRGGSSVEPKGDDRKHADATKPARINLGIDFGTAFTKVCYRDVARERSGTVAFDATGTGDWADGSLIVSKAALTKDGTFKAGLTQAEWEKANFPSGSVIDHLKMRLAQIDLEEDLAGFDLPADSLVERDTDVELFCACFLANVIVRAKASAQSQLKESLRGRKVQWSAKVGVPVRIMNSPAIERFQRVLRDAWMISERTGKQITEISTGRTIFEEVRRSAEKIDVDIFAYPEIGAAVEAFLTSRAAREGFYIYFDVGGGTMDGVSFRFRRDQGRRIVNYYGADIQPLGVSALLSKNEVSDEESAFVDLQKDPVPENTMETFQQEYKSIQSLVAGIVMAAKNLDGYTWIHEAGMSNWAQATRAGQRPRERSPLYVMLGGGGGRLNFYWECVVDAYENRGLSRCSIPPYELESVPVPSDFDLGPVPPEHFDRFAVAYGLSIPEGQGAGYRLPEEFEPVSVELPEVQAIGVYDD
jgi:hypothetical protein